MRRGSLVVILLAAGCRPAPVPPPPASDLDRLQGEWQAVRIEDKGADYRPERTAKLRFVVRGGEMFPANKPDDPARITLSPDAAPSLIDLTDAKGVSPGIYRLSGDRWEWCFADPGRDRPAEFRTAPGDGCHLMILERRKP